MTSEPSDESVPSTHAVMTAETDASPSLGLASVPAAMAACVFDASAARKRRMVLVSTADAVEASKHHDTAMLS